MPDLNAALAKLKRPSLLVRAARHGLLDYNRTRDLRRISGHTTTANPRQLVSHLLAQEEALESTRTTRDGTYSPNKHIEVLVALMAESRAMPTAPRAARRDTGWRPTTV